MKKITILCVATLILLLLGTASVVRAMQVSVSIHAETAYISSECCAHWLVLKKFVAVESQVNAFLRKLLFLNQVTFVMNQSNTASRNCLCYCM
jgi:hypothetical protein